MNVQAVCVTPFGHQRELKAATQSKSRFSTQILTEQPKISAAEYAEAELEAGSGRRALAHKPVALTCSLDQPRAAEGSYLTFVEHLSLRDQIYKAYELTGPGLVTNACSSTTTRHI